MDEKSVGTISVQGPLHQKVYVDGAANHRGSGVGLVLISSEKIIIEKSLRLGFSATNNEAEYEALLQGMAMVQKIRGKVVEVFSDSRLVMGQVKRKLEARDVRMQGYLSQVKHLQLDFEFFDVSHVSRSGNTQADSLATLAPPLRHRVYLESSLLRTCVEQMESRRTWFRSIKSKWVRSGWILQ